MNARLHERRETFPNDPPRTVSEVDDFAKNFSDGARLWCEVFCNLDAEAQTAFMVRLKVSPARAATYLHDEAREYLYAFVAEHGLDKARESWG